MSAITDRYHALPRAAKWGVWALGALVAFEAWNLSTETRDAFGSRADTAARDIETYEQRLARVNSGGRGQSMERHGDVVGPGAPGERRAAVSALVNTLVADLRIADGWRLTEQSGPLREDRIEAIFDNRDIERLTFTFSFESDAETATAVVKGLEAAPIVVSVPRVNMRVIDRGAKRVSVRVDAETWVFADGGGPRGRRS